MTRCWNVCRNRDLIHTLTFSFSTNSSVFWLGPPHWGRLTHRLLQTTADSSFIFSSCRLNDSELRSVMAPLSREGTSSRVLLRTQDQMVDLTLAWIRRGFNVWQPVVCHILVRVPDGGGFSRNVPVSHSRVMDGPQISLQLRVLNDEERKLFIWPPAVTGRCCRDRGTLCERQICTKTNKTWQNERSADMLLTSQSSWGNKFHY